MRKAMIAVMTAVATLLILALSMNVADATTTIGTVKIVVNGTTYAPIPVTTVTSTVTKTVTATSTPTVTVTQPAVTVTAPPVTVTSTVTAAPPVVTPYATDVQYPGPAAAAQAQGTVGLLQHMSDDTPTHHYDVLLPNNVSSSLYFQHTEGVYIMPSAGFEGAVSWGVNGEHVLGSFSAAAFVPLAETGPVFTVRFALNP